jgi:hypothetical protein
MRFHKLTIILFCGILFSESCTKKKGGNDGAGDSTLLYYEFHDFESLADARLDSTKASSGRKSALLNDKIEYGFGITKQIKDLPSYNNISEITVSFKCWMDKACPDALFVLAIDDVTPTNIVWDGRPIAPSKYNEWVPVSITYKVNKKHLNPEYFLKLYVWNKGKNRFNFDDASFSFVQKKPTVK